MGKYSDQTPGPKWDYTPKRDDEYLRHFYMEVPPPGLGIDFQKSPSSDFIWRGTRPLATSSLAVGRFAAKKGSLRSPRGRLVASLALALKVIISLNDLDTIFKTLTEGHTLNDKFANQMFDNDLENHTLLPVTSRVKPDKGVPPEPIRRGRLCLPISSFRLH